MLFPIPPRVGVAIQSKNEWTHWVRDVVPGSICRPFMPRDTNPGDDVAAELALRVCRLGI